jgi:hypothetical protein
MGLKSRFLRMRRRRSEKQAFGFITLTPEENGNNQVVDIVAVHGFNGHREKTWTADNGINWLKDLLPKQITNARILSYGYDATTHGFGSQQSLHNHGMSLLVDLSLLRRSTNTEKRPIIFIAYSLGGIICKIALVQANLANQSHLPDHKTISISTYGVLYFGTPHQGGRGVPLTGSFIQAASALGPTNKELLRNLEMHSAFLQHQTDQYNAISTQLETKFFYETDLTRTKNGLIQVVPVYSAVIPGAVNAESIAINGDHLNIVKFRSNEDEGFQKAYRVLRLMVPDAVSKIQGRWA